MAKLTGQKRYFAFVGGLSTESSPLNAPANTWADGDNVTPQVDGSLTLRPAVDYEQNAAASSVTLTSTQEGQGAFVTAEWNGVAGNGNLHFLVVQQDKTVSFFTNSGATISDQERSFTIDLSAYKAATSTETSGTAPIACATANGKLIIVSRDTNPLLVTYDEDTNTIDVEVISIDIRDFAGLDDGLDVNERPGSLSASHNYNLLNQGWNSTVITTYQAGAGVYPSNAQSWTAGKDSSDNFSQALLDKQDFGTSQSPKGRFVLNVFNRDRSTASGVGGITTESENYRPVTVAFMAGRAWYAGVRSPTIGSWVFFSQVAETTDNLGKCYQDADPTSEVISDLLETDGGVIPIQDAGNVLRLLPYANTILVIADNGVWQIAGGGVDSAFSASSYEVRRLSFFGCVSAKSVVVTDYGIFFWGEDAIYLAQSSNTGMIDIKPVTPGTIQTVYDEIPMTGKVFSTGVFVPDERIVYWAYNNDVVDGISSRFMKNRFLIFDTKIKAFYTHTISAVEGSSPYLADMFITKTKASSTTVYTVVDASVNTVVVGTDTVVATQNPATISAVALKFLVVYPVSTNFKVTVGEFNITDDAPIKWYDWYYFDNFGAEYTGYVVPAYDFGGEGQGGDKMIQALYVLTFMRRTETGVDADGDAINPSSCLMSSRWNFADTDAGNEFGVSQQVYRHKRMFVPGVPSSTYNDGTPVVMTKNKIRGRGRALQLKFTSVPGNDMQILGWSITFLGNANV